MKIEEAILCMCLQNGTEVVMHYPDTFVKAEGRIMLMI